MKEKIINILAAFALAVIWVELWTKTGVLLRSVDVGQVFILFRRPSLLDYFMALILAPIWEEYVFRHVPLKLALKGNDKDVIWFTIIITSVIFGVCHGGVGNIFIQGVVGFISANLYIKNNKSYWSCVLFHFMYNFYAIFF